MPESCSSCRAPIQLTQALVMGGALATAIALVIHATFDFDQVDASRNRKKSMKGFGES